MDIFVEQLIRKRKSAVDRLMISGIIFAAAALSLAAVFFLPTSVFLNILIVFVICAGTYFLLNNFNVEYEYAFINGEITVDKIIAKRRRKRIAVFEAKNADEMGTYVPQRHEQKEYGRVVVAADGRDDGDWYMVFSNTLFVFSPNERVLDAIKSGLRPSVARETFGRVSLKR